ncbi:outer membrane protein [Gilvibacter sp.]|uniref:outer membrane protein n=1 Tax=Gilvibacter sp. TaxID=2729997 RepID=UPI003F4A4DC8
MNRNYLILLGLLFCGVFASAQERKFSVEWNYPLPVGDNFFAEGYTAWFDIGGEYRFAESGAFNFGVALNMGFAGFSETLDTGTTKAIAYDFKPSVFAELNIPGVPKLHPAVGVGYNTILFAFSGDSAILGSEGRQIIGGDSKNGLNGHARLSYDVAERWFVQVQYDYTRLGKENDVPDISFNRTVSQVRFGFGYRI